MIDTREKFLDLLKEKAYRKGEFKLSSGKTSEHYVNCKPVTLQADALAFISWCILECMEEDSVAIAGLTLGADPLVAGTAVVSAIDERPVAGLIVRKEPKGHGTGAWIEGPELPKGSKVTVVEDVVTTGGSALKAVEKLREHGYEVDRVVCIVDRQECETFTWFDKSLELTSLFLLEEICE
tara:strand:+ start:1949 stop:2491 length:543 start_codon:yes stop_codon:yes gene_type:complete